MASKETANKENASGVKGGDILTGKALQPKDVNFDNLKEALMANRSHKTNDNL